jgi:hypothetical protein
VILFILLPNPILVYVHVLVDLFELRRVFIVAVSSPSRALCGSTACCVIPWGAVAGC